MKSTRSLCAALLAVLFSGGPALSQHMDHSAHMQHSATQGDPQEPGQGAFAAIAEIVAILRADPETDWSKINIAALRSHLVDMNALVLGAEVETQITPDGLIMQISLAGPAGAAAARMVPAHGPFLAAESGWLSDVQVATDSITWSVTDPAGEGIAQIQALGFFGLMAIGDHHRAHHIAMARGVAGH